jgi:hypothetical protein
MADTRQRTTWGNRFRFLARAVGLTGVAAVASGAVLAAATLPPIDLGAWAGWKSLPDVLRAATEGAHGEMARVGAWLIAGGVAAVVVTLFVEVIGAAALGAGKRTAAGTVATVGVVAAVALLLIVNAYSFTHYRRYDTTRDQRFTLPPDLAAELGKLRGKPSTTIVVLQRHNTFGTLSTTRDSFTSAAERQVTEKVLDLVDQFREFGPQFSVAVLDTEAFEYERELAALTKDAPELKSAIDAAPENSIFFYANKRVQRLSFNEFMQLDKTASREADDGRGNLVLIPQGIDRFARRILTVQERRPKVAVCVVHEWLTTAATEGQEEFSLAGLKKSLAEQGFDVVDIVLKKNWADSTKDLEPAAYSLQENKLERLEGDADAAREALRSAQDDVRILEAVRRAAEEAQQRPWEDRAAFYNSLLEGTRQREWTELLAAFKKWSATGRPVQGNEDEFRKLLFAGLKGQAALAETQVSEAERDQRDTEAKLKAAYLDEKSLQDRRVLDVKEKFKRLLSDVDLLVVPRYTVVNATIGRTLSPTLHTMDKTHVEVVKEFMKSGKPVLACMGPISSPSGPQTEATDGFERLLRERGIELGRETIIFEGERKAFTAARAGAMLSGAGTEIPPLLLADAPGADSKLKANPIASTMRLTARTAEQSLDLRLRAPRPVYLAPGWPERVPFAAEFLLTAPGAWNEERPFVTADRSGRITYIPRYEPTAADDPKRNTRAEERKASFPIAVAVESKIPATWVTDEYEAQQLAAIVAPLERLPASGLVQVAEHNDRPKQRTVVFGSGHMFNGSKLEPPQERLLLHSVNWLTGREDRLPKSATDATPEWHYPRVAMSDRDRTLWRLGAAVGMPLVVAYAGLLVMMRRRMR